MEEGVRGSLVERGMEANPIKGKKTGVISKNMPRNSIDSHKRKEKKGSHFERSCCFLLKLEG